MNLERFALQVKNGVISGNDLKEKVDRNEMTKGDRRKIMKMVSQMTTRESMTARQKLRLEVKEKKKLPKLTKEDRKRKYQKDLETEREKEQANFTICLGCRKRGHFVKDCPRRQMAAQQQEYCNEVCFNCGSYEHTLKNCPVPRDRSGQLPFAKCFICKQSGHISRDCPENANGLYPMGGCCHICFQKTHLAKDCPDKKFDLPPPPAASESVVEENEDGVRVKGLSVQDSSALGDDAIVDVNDYGSDHEESDGEQKKRKKKSSKKRKKEAAANQK